MSCAAAQLSSQKMEVFSVFSAQLSDKSARSSLDKSGFVFGLMIEFGFWFKFGYGFRFGFDH